MFDKIKKLRENEFVSWVGLLSFFSLILLVLSVFISRIEFADPDESNPQSSDGKRSFIGFGDTGFLPVNSTLKFYFAFREGEDFLRNEEFLGRVVQSVKSCNRDGSKRPKVAIRGFASSSGGKLADPESGNLDLANARINYLANKLEELGEDKIDFQRYTWEFSEENKAEVYRRMMTEAGFKDAFGSEYSEEAGLLNRRAEIVIGRLEDRAEISLEDEGECLLESNYNQAQAQ